MVYGKSKTQDPGLSTGGPQDLGSRTQKCLGGIQDPELPKWDPGPGTPKYSSGTRNPGTP